jgi:hypothetical protein
MFETVVRGGPDAQSISSRHGAMFDVVVGRRQGRSSLVRQRLLAEAEQTHRRRRPRGTGKAPAFLLLGPRYIVQYTHHIRGRP